MDYFGIFPFTQDREDFRMARLAEALNNIPQGRAIKDATWMFFMPDYLGDIQRQIEVDEEQRQINMELAWAARLGG